VISNDPETVDLYKNHHQLHWANAGDFVLKTAFPRTELRENVTCADIVDAVIGCAKLLFEECVAMNKSPEEIGSPYWVKDNDIVIDNETSSLSEIDGDIIALHAVRLTKDKSEPLLIEMFFRPESPLTESVQKNRNKK
jgi:hypothetical protein